MEDTDQVVTGASPECIIRAIQHCSKNGFLDLAELIKRTKITKMHDEIIEAWKKRVEFFKETDHGATESILAQKQTIGACQ